MSFMPLLTATHIQPALVQSRTVVQRTFQRRQLKERDFYNGSTADTPHFRVRVWTGADGADG